jgi:uncharacterized protein YciW
MPRPHHPNSNEVQLQRKIDTLQIRLLHVNSALRLKSIYAERLEVLLHKRNERIDQLSSLLEQSRTTNHRLELECEHLAQLIATPQQPLLT